MTQQTLFDALYEVQKKIKNPGKDADNPHFRSKYTDLFTWLETVRPVLNECNLVLTQGIERSGEFWIVRTTLIHKSGQSIDTITPIMSERTGPQAFSSALRYARRQGIACMFPVDGRGEDDDGEAAEGRQSHQKTPARQPMDKSASFATVEEAKSSAETVRNREDLSR